MIKFNLNELMILRSALPKFIEGVELAEFEIALVNKALHGEKSLDRAKKLLEKVNEQIYKLTGAPICVGCGDGYGG